MKNKTHANGIIFQWSFFYVVISLIVIIGSWFYFKKYTKEITQEKTTTNAVMLEILRYEMDENVQNFNILCSSLTLSKSVNELRYINSYKDASRYKIYQVAKELHDYSVIRNVQDSVYIYYPQIDLMMGDLSYNQSSDFYDIQISPLGIDYEEWSNIISGEYSGTQVFSLKSNNKEKTAGYWVIVRTINNLGSMPSSVNAIMILDLDDMLPYSKVLYEQRETILIINENSQSVIAESELSDKEVQTIMKEIKDKDSGNVFVEMDHGRSLISFIQSDRKQWKYIVINPEAVWLQQINHMQQIMILFILGYLIISFIILIASIIRSYIPVKRLVRILDGEHQNAVDDFKYGYDYITNKVREYVDENKKNQNVITKQKNAIRLEMIHRLLVVTKEYELPDENMLEQYGIVFQSKRNYVIAYQIENEFNEQRKSEELLMTQFIMNNITDEVFHGQQFLNYWIDEENIQIHIINVPETMEDPMNRITQCLDMIYAFLERYYQISYRTAISDEHEGILKIHQAYMEVQRILRYQSDSGSAKSMTFHEINLFPLDTMLKVPADIENQLKRSIQTADFFETSQIFHWVIEENYKQCTTPEVMQFLVRDILNILVHAAKKYMAENKLTNIRAVLIDQGIYESKDSVMKALDSVGKSLCDEVRLAKGKMQIDKKKNVIADIKQYVEENFSDCSIGVTSIAEQFEMKQSYLSKMFKEQEGENLSTYLSMVRLNHAKELLLQGEKLEVISQSCGFGSQRTFLRIFKQYTGITPTSYKEL